MKVKSRVWTPIDFERDGKFSDSLRVPYSSDKSGYGVIPIPIVVIRNGPGRTALLVGGNHGDEYEGQVALMNLARKLRKEDVVGRVIIIPSLNYPAVRAGKRVSPLDNGNLNRMFPGNPLGTPTQMIAHYTSDVLMPMADVACDLHSGGYSLDYLCTMFMRTGRSDEETRNLLDLANLFGTPVTVVSDGSAGGGATTFNAVTRELGIPTLTTELGGSATLTPVGIELAEEGVLRVLKHFEITPRVEVPPTKGTEFMEIPGHDYYLYANADGLFEPAAKPGDEVVEGQFAGRIHALDDPLKEPLELRFPKTGRLAFRRFPSLTEKGDCLYEIMRPRKK